MAIAGNLAVNALTHTQAAKQAQKLQQKKSKQLIQRGGVMYAENARKMVHQENLDNLQKARNVLALAKAKKARVKKAKLQVLMKKIKSKLKGKSQHCTTHIKQIKVFCQNVKQKVKVIG